MSIKWKKEYSVNVKVFDEHHKILFENINKLYNAINEMRFGDEAEKVLEELIEYGKKHLSLEEEYFDKYNYPDAKEHKEKHQEYLEKMQFFENNFKNKEVELSFELTDFLEDWWIKHVSNVDKEYTKFFNDLGVR